ncbi:hypothetical protein S7711_10307 [Stachybotrys chartarum IBT 7711]|uniref:Uncharacterized protein n=1 Tax=Stachybotrys chartarum (strain CBS 109288 / IBT 7711) TaxID=1280523 RepID=A0A084B8H1_STACB|nr:hypothetical protein S7711_10307 [Stachybotrys chartarum IBT 7711]
MARLLLLPLLV